MSKIPTTDNLSTPDPTYTSTFAPFTDMMQIADKQNIDYVVKHLGQDIEKTNPTDIINLCFKAISENNEEMFWRSWAVTAQIMAYYSPDKMSNEKKNEVLDEIARLGGRTWNHENILCVKFN